MHSSEHPTNDDEWKKRAKPKSDKKRFGIETRHKPKMVFGDSPEIRNGTKLWRSIWVDEFTDWRVVCWYLTERDRNEALKHYQSKTSFTLPNGTKLDWIDEYRIIER